MSYSDVESSNIVGYANDMAVNDGYTTAGASFFNVGEDVLSIQKSLSATGASDGGVELWVMSKYMTAVKKAYWFNAYEDLPAGWFDENGEEEVDVDVAKGTGVILKNGDAGVQMGQAGEVLIAGVEGIPVNDGYTVFANPYATTLPLANVAAIGASDGGLEAWVTTKYMTASKKAYWFNAYEDLPAGWFDENGEEEVTDVSVAPGMALVLKNGDAGVSVNVTSPMAK